MRPDSHAIILGDANVQQSTRKTVRFPIQLAVAHANGLMARHQRLAFRKALGHGFKMTADGGLNQRNRGIANVVAESQGFESAHAFSSEVAAVLFNSDANFQPTVFKKSRKEPGRQSNQAGANKPSPKLIVASVHQMLMPSSLSRSPGFSAIDRV